MFFVFLLFSKSEWSESFDGDPDNEITGNLNETGFPVSLSNLWMHDVVAISFQNQLINLDIRDFNYNLLVEDCFFQNFTSTKRGGIIYYINPGDIKMQKICVNKCDLTTTRLTGAFAFTVYSENYIADLISLHAAPSYDQFAMATFNMLANDVVCTSINSSASSAVSIGAQINNWGTFSYCLFLSHHTYDRNTMYIVLSMNSDIIFSNFLNNTLDYSRASIVGCQNAANVISYVSGCSFINNSARSVCTPVSQGEFCITDCYIDEGTINKGTWTNLINIEQTIPQTHFSTRNVCMTDPLLASYEVTYHRITPSPSIDLFTQNITQIGETMRVATITATCAAGIGFSGTIIWAAKKILKKVLKNGAKMALFGSDSYEEEEEEEEEYTYETDESQSYDKQSDSCSNNSNKTEENNSHETNENSTIDTQTNNLSPLVPEDNINQEEIDKQINNEASKNQIIHDENPNHSLQLKNNNIHAEAQVLNNQLANNKIPHESVKSKENSDVSIDEEYSYYEEDVNDGKTELSDTSYYSDV